MMICFICKKDFLNFSALIVHLKIIHLLKSSSSYECVENQCTQFFPNLSSYKRHVTIKHLKNTFSLPTSTLNNSNTICNNINTSTITETPIDTVCSHDIPNYNQPPPPESSDNSIDLSSIINSFHISAVTFTLSLLNKNNFTRKDVFDIQQKMKISLLEPIVSLLTSFTKETIKEPTLLAKFQTIKTAISNTFNFCNTEHSLNNEAKHKEMKLYAHAITSRKNITLSLAKKFQYKFSYSILQSSFNTEIITNKIHVSSSNYTQLILRTLNLTSDQFLCYSQIESKGTTYKVGYFLTNFIDELCLYEILEILVIKENYKIKLIVQQIEIDLYNSHLKSYQINKTKNIILKKILSPGECSGPPVNLHEVNNGNLMLRLKEYYSD